MEFQAYEEELEDEEDEDPDSDRRMLGKGKGGGGGKSKGSSSSSSGGQQSLDDVEPELLCLKATPTDKYVNKDHANLKA